MEKRSCLVPFVLIVCFNILQFSTYVLKVPPLFLVCKLVVLFVVFGGLLKTLIGDKFKVKKEVSNEVVSQRKVEKVVKAACSSVNLLLSKLISIVTWEDTAKSLISLAGFYLLGLLLKVVPSVMVTFALVWALFLYVYMREFVEKNVFVHFEPYVKTVSDYAKKYYHTIPKIRENKML